MSLDICLKEHAFSLHSTHKYPHVKNENKIPNSFKHFSLWIVFLSTLHLSSFASEYADTPGYFCPLHFYSYHSVPLMTINFHPSTAPTYACWSMPSYDCLTRCFSPQCPCTAEKFFNIVSWTMLLLCLKSGYLACLFLKGHFARHLSSMLSQAISLPLSLP